VEFSTFYSEFHEINSKRSEIELPNKGSAGTKSEKEIIKSDREESSAKALSTRYHFSSTKSLPKLPEPAHNQDYYHEENAYSPQHLYYRTAHSNFSHPFVDANMRNSTFFPHLTYSNFSGSGTSPKQVESVSQIGADLYYPDPNGIIVYYKKPFLSKKSSATSPKSRPLSSQSKRNSFPNIKFDIPPKKIFVQGNNINPRNSYY